MIASRKPNAYTWDIFEWENDDYGNKSLASKRHSAKRIRQAKNMKTQKDYMTKRIRWPKAINNGEPIRNWRCPGARAHSSRRKWQRIGATDQNWFVSKQTIVRMPKLILAGKSHGGRCPGPYLWWNDDAWWWDHDETDLHVRKASLA